ENLDRKCEFFRKELPEDSRLHRLYRRVDFMEMVEDFKTELLNIDDQLIDTESNLWYIVLQKNLYKVGLPVDLFESYHRDLDALVNRRNTIAHGSFRSGVTEQDFTN
ncbi:MAE_28990/MAE_18760 family HEPN-like nuclease, partial [Anaerostipes caccae]|uniref:MAE_28990/MAE_18760 family HEPN-like nuclease n=1 Tax=Anaerostipes caccae TaxID=105841 RepID=UPI00210E107E